MSCDTRIHPKHITNQTPTLNLCPIPAVIQFNNRTVGEILAGMRASSQNPREKGTHFEKLFRKVAPCIPELEVENICAWADWPGLTHAKPGIFNLRWIVATCAYTDTTEKIAAEHVIHNIDFGEYLALKLGSAPHKRKGWMKSAASNCT